MTAEEEALAGFRTGMAQSLMQEIAERLAELARSGEPSAIDLRSLPMTIADRRELEESLGRGDVEATLSVAGRSEVRETGYAGVWWVCHFGAGDAVATERIEIAAVPEILVTDAADIEAAAERLRDALAAHSGVAAKEEVEHA